MNPFTPGFGTTPQLLVGRDEVLEEVAQAFSSSFDPHRTTWLRAPRGTGKTVILNELQTLAGQAGWIVIQEDAQSPGNLVQRITTRLQHTTDPTASSRRFRSASLQTPLGGGSIELTDPSPDQVELRDAITSILEAPDPPAGILITVDEIHSADRHELAHFGNVIQHLIRDDHPVATIVAGLPGDTADDDADDLATFLGRCTKPRLAALPANTVRVGLQQTARIGNGGFTADALDLATDVTAGYAYMLQLVGYWSWRESTDGTITYPHVRRALPRCQHELLEAIPGLKHIHVSPAMNTYLTAMAQDDDSSNTGIIAGRLGITAQHAGVFRERLIDAGLITAVSRGLVNLALPGHRAALRINHIIDQLP